MGSGQGAESGTRGRGAEIRGEEGERTKKRTVSTKVGQRVQGIDGGEELAMVQPKNLTVICPVAERAPGPRDPVQLYRCMPRIEERFSAAR
jgi:hypothetical protein